MKELEEAGFKYSWKKEDSYCGSMKKSGVNKDFRLKAKAKAKDLDPKAKPRT